MLHPNESEILPLLTTFEVTIPADRTEQLLALEGLASTFGWDLCQIIDPSDKGEVIRGSYLHTISGQMFGDVHYGKTAASIIQKDAEHVRTDIINRNGSIEFDYYNPARGLTNTYIGPAGTSKSEIMRIAKEELDQHAFPVNVGFTEAQNLYDFEKKLLSVVPLDATVERLARFLENRGLHEHELHGLLGKSLDLLNSVAGIAEPHATEPYNPEDYIQIDLLSQIAMEQGVSRTSITSLKERIMWALVGQLHTGKPVDKFGGEVIIEEYYDATQWHSSYIGPQSIAISSLVNLGETARKNAKYSPFLKELPEILAETK